MQTGSLKNHLQNVKKTKLTEDDIKEAYGGLMSDRYEVPVADSKSPRVVKIHGVSDKFPYSKDLDQHTSFLYVG